MRRVDHAGLASAGQAWLREHVNAVKALVTSSVKWSPPTTPEAQREAVVVDDLERSRETFRYKAGRLAGRSGHFRPALLVSCVWS
jgi:hypothetical protein